MKKLPLIIFLIFLFSCNQSQRGQIAFEGNSIATFLNKQNYSKREFKNKVSQQFNQYCNERFKFCIEYPSNFIPQGEPGNADGQIFLSNDGEIEIRAYGSLPFEGIDFTLKKKYKNEVEKKKITYQVIKDDWFIISGYEKNGNIFYQKTVLKDINYGNTGNRTYVYQTLRITYPKDMANKYSYYCNKIAKSL